MAKSVTAVACGLALGLAATAANAGNYDAMVGQWAWQGFTIEVTKGGDHGVSAEVVDGPKNVGMQMIRSDLERKDGAFVGQVKHPANGKVYNTRISRKGSDAWKLNGCTDGGACASGVFKRVD